MGHFIHVSPTKAFILWFRRTHQWGTSPPFSSSPVFCETAALAYWSVSEKNDCIKERHMGHLSNLWRHTAQMHVCLHGKIATEMLFSWHTTQLSISSLSQSSRDCSTSSLMFPSTGSLVFSVSSSLEATYSCYNKVRYIIYNSSTNKWWKTAELWLECTNNKLWLSWKVIYEMITFCLINVCSKIFQHLKILSPLM